MCPEQTFQKGNSGDDWRKNRVGFNHDGGMLISMNDYERIAKVIRFLNASHQEQPRLSELAGLVGLSPHHFQRLFRSWAGVTPKEFLQCLTYEHARKVLLSGSSVLDAALESGLSGPARLHDLCIKLEAATPGEIKSGGAGWTNLAGYAETPFGEVLIGENPRGICSLSFMDEESRPQGWLDLQRQWPKAKWVRDDRRAVQWAEQIFQEGSGANLRAHVKATAFQVRVWQALLRIPPGCLVTYGRLAEAIGHSGAARAVGTAVGKNPIAYLIPCHRVIRETGALGGYRWDPLRKSLMIARESIDSLGTGETARRESMGEDFRTCESVK